jgi:hypothetical protein
VAYSAASYHLVLGVPGLPYTGAFARFMGWQQATAELQAVQARLQQATGLAPVVVGLDKYNTASQIGFLRRGALCGARAGRAAGDLAGDFQRQRADVHLLEPAGQPGGSANDPGGARA